MSKRKTFRRRLALCVGLVAIAATDAAGAQTMFSNSASFNAGYGRTSDAENSPVDIQMTDANGNLTVVNGLIRNNSSSIFAQASAFASASGAADSFSGAGSTGSASAIGNNLNVVTQGNNNIVIVSSTQTNTGDVSANTTTNGKQ